MKKIFLLLSIGLLFIWVLPESVSAQAASGSGFVPLAPIPGLTQGVVANSSGLVNFLQNLYKYLIGVAVVLAIVMITWGGIEIAARDSISKQSSGREHITQAILGLVLILAPVLIFTIINPAILNLSVNLPPLNTQWGTSQDSTQGLAATANTRLATNQQFVQCSDKTSCDAADNVCESKGGSGSIECFDSNDGNFYDTSEVSSTLHVVSAGYLGGTACASSGQQLGVVCTGASQQFAGAAQSGSGVLMNTQNVAFSRFTSASAAQNFKCTNSNQSGPVVFSGPAGSANSSYSYALCIRTSLPYVDVYTSGVARGATPETLAAKTAYTQDCDALVSAEKNEGFTSGVPIPRENIDPKKTSCTDQTIGKYAADAVCYTVTATCGAE